MHVCACICMYLYVSTDCHCSPVVVFNMYYVCMCMYLNVLCMYACFGNMSRHILKQMDVHACPCLCMYATLCFESVLEQLRQFLLVSECVCALYWNALLLTG